MNYNYYLIFVVACLCTCKPSTDDKTPDSNNSITIEQIELISNDYSTDFDLDVHLKNYTQLKNKISQKRSQIKNHPNHAPSQKLEQAEIYISKILIDSIFEYWAGTPWDFNGHTDHPREGEVACGYYISTTLKHIGCKLNRFKLAQKSASGIIKDLCASSTKHFTDFNDLDANLQTIKENEILVIGLDFHVGFIYKKNNQIYFAHSNYINRKGVVKELINNSPALKSSKTYLLGRLTKNKNFIASWLES